MSTQSKSQVKVQPDITEILNKKPAKGILKSSSSFETSDAAKCRKSQADKAAKFDEMNIIATLHPPDKDYGHMKVSEPKTPFEREIPDDEADAGVDPSLLTEKIQSNIEADAPLKIHVTKSDEEESSDEDKDETPEQRAARKAFEMKRKAHYNEFYAVKMARKLLQEEMEDEDETEDAKGDESAQRNADEAV